MSLELITLVITVAGGIIGSALGVLGWFVNRLLAQVDAQRERIEALERQRAASQAIAATLPTLDNFRDLLITQLGPIQTSVDTMTRSIQDHHERLLKLELRSEVR